MTSVIIYTYFQSASSDFNLNYFVKNELSFKDNIDYIIVINGHNINENIIFPNIQNLTILKRENIGYDFGGHNFALKYIRDKLKTYEYYFFINSGAIGPIFPHYYKEHWSNIFINKINDKVKLVGTTIVCLPHSDAGGYGPKIEGFFFMTDKIGLEILENEKNIFFDHPTKYSAIVYGEYGLSNCIFKNGYSIDCMLTKYQNIDWTNPSNYNLNNNIHPSRNNSFYGYSINPYEVIFHKWYWHGDATVNLNIIQQHIFNQTNSHKTYIF